MNSDYIKSVRLVTQATRELDQGLSEMASVVAVLLLAMGVILGLCLTLWIFRGGLSGNRTFRTTAKLSQEIEGAWQQES